MHNLDLLIADSSEDFAQALAAELEEPYHVHCCTNGRDTLELLRRTRPDILVLDLMLPELDGISLLQTAAREGICPRVLAVTPLVSDYVVEAARSLGIGYLIRKPCDVRATAMRVDDLNNCLPPQLSPEDPRSRCADMLLDMGLSPKHRGYHYLREAVVLMARDPGQSVTKELYPEVARVCRSQAHHVERSIRSALSAAWNQREGEVWAQYFHRDRCPSNAVFISRLAEELRNSGKIEGLGRDTNYG
ncbi:MAG: sporulation initiation factor Spo0A C-terminal domain-containing protein [Eubacteriales bacterium]|nr:sporulation initiation factor Spo0A C-terminal domain-containing protein [Eubacteriales bacterium]